MLQYLYWVLTCFSVWLRCCRNTPAYQRRTLYRCSGSLDLRLRAWGAAIPITPSCQVFPLISFCKSELQIGHAKEYGWFHALSGQQHPYALEVVGVKLPSCYSLFTHATHHQLWTPVSQGVSAVYHSMAMAGTQPADQTGGLCHTWSHFIQLPCGAWKTALVKLATWWHTSSTTSWRHSDDAAFSHEGFVEAWPSPPCAVFCVFEGSHATFVLFWGLSCCLLWSLNSLSVISNPFKLFHEAWWW